MRIRTIKPEFWKHPVLSALAPEARLLALGCLSMADDEGYFYADARIVRGEVMPFDDDSSKVRRWLDDLSNVGWIEVRETPGHGRIGRVVNFAKHQRIDRARDSELAKYFNDSVSVPVSESFDEDSSKPRRGLGEDSLLEGKGKEGKGREPEAAPPHPLQAIWNQNKAPEQPEWKETSRTRRKHADARWRERPSGEWVAIVERLARSRFARGLVVSSDGRTWVADADFLLKPDTAAKVLEGKYDDRGPVLAPVPLEHRPGRVL